MATSPNDNDVMSVDSDTDSDAIVINRDDVSNYNPEQILPQSPEVIQQIRSWLQPTSYDIVGGEYRKHHASHVAGTGAWLSESSTYQKWLHGEEDGLLWIKGIPGSGKSVVAANLVSELTTTNPGTPVLYFFFRQIIQANHQPEALLRDWMDQVLDYSPPLQRQLKSYVDTSRAIDSISMEDLWADLRMALRGLPGKVHCVADALDEMDQGNDAFLQALAALGQWRPATVKVLITSRPVPSVEGSLRKTPCLHIRLEEALVDLDISRFVLHSLSNSDIPQSEWNTIKEAVPGRANGLFLYAKLAMEAFLEPGADAKTVISQLPADLNVLYTDLLREHAKRSGVAPSIQRLILQSVTHATRPLRLLELAEMLRGIDVPGEPARDLKGTKDLVRAACGPLLEILADETVSVVHHSFTEYLKGTIRSRTDSGYPVLEMGPAHGQLALACLRYLQSSCSNTTDEKTPENGAAVDVSLHETYGFDSKYPFEIRGSIQRLGAKHRLQYPFFAYAVDNWHVHTNNSEASGYDQSEIETELGKFLGEDRSRQAWLKLQWPQGDTRSSNVTQLHIAAYTGLVSYTRVLVSEKAEIDAIDIDGKTPLWWAAHKGHAGVIRELAAAGANCEKDDNENGLKPLHEAASRNHYEAVRALLEAGVDPLTPKTRENPGRRCGNAKRTQGETPLEYACRNGHVETVDVFLSLMKDNSDLPQRALRWAAQAGRSQAVARILQHPGVNVNAMSPFGTPLYQACGNPDAATILTLLDAGADPRIGLVEQNPYHTLLINGKRPAPMFVMHGSRSFQPSCIHELFKMTPHGSPHRIPPEDLTAVLSAFLRAGADIREINSQGQTLLHGAVGTPVLLRLLLDAGADANCTDRNGIAPLHLVRNKDCMMLLVEQGHADINLQRPDGSTPLLCMLEHNNEELVSKFLEYGPDCSITDRTGNGPLHVLYKGYWQAPNITHALVAAGADPNLKNHDGLTPLLAMKKDNGSKFMEKINLLVQVGADLNALDRGGASLLFLSLPRPLDNNTAIPFEDLQQLIDRGVSVFHRDFKGRTLLHEAVKCQEVNGTVGVGPSILKVEFLLDHGLKLDVVDYEGNGLLHELAKCDNNHNSLRFPSMLSKWKSLFANGLDPNQRNHVGRTPLHILCSDSTQEKHLKLGEMTPLDLLISETENIDVPDRDGFTPLHLAVMNGEVYSKKLLDAGADPSLATQEGLTPLHLASRCRQSNVVGLLLNSLGGRSSKLQSDDSLIDKYGPLSSDGTHIVPHPVPGINARAFGSRSDITPLFYACRSGRPETVALLLEAGADVNIGDVFEACVGFENESTVWTAHVQSKSSRKASQYSSELHDFFRPNLENRDRGGMRDLSPDETTRLDDIIDLLLKYGAKYVDPSASSRRLESLDQAFKDGNDYTAVCLADARERNPADPTTSDYRPTTYVWTKAKSTSAREAAIQSLKDSKLVMRGHGNQNLVRDFLRRREYYLVEQLVHLGATFLPTPREIQGCDLSILIKHGFATLLEKIGMEEAQMRFADGDWHAFGDSTKPGLWLAKREAFETASSGRCPDDFLREAVMRELPNMEVVRVLVEKLGIPVLETNIESHPKKGSRISAVHQVAKGKHWWHVHQALPYFIKSGIDLDTADAQGYTPLHWALVGDNRFPCTYSGDSARMLIEAGADVNAVTHKGETCLALAQHDVDLVKLLITHGARVTPDALFSAIKPPNVEGLRALLSGGIDVNARRDKKPDDDTQPMQRNREVMFGAKYLPEHEKYPLFHAARDLRPAPYPPGQGNNDVMRQYHHDLEKKSQVVQTLLDHGANPFAKYMMQSKVTPNSKAPPEIEECTILHQLLLMGIVPDIFINIPGLDVNHRDASGRTLLHCACKSRLGADYVLGSQEDNPNPSHDGTSVFNRLIELGADLEARDKFDRNVLHHLSSSPMGEVAIPFENIKKSLKYAVENAPGLINQADSSGQTPLIHAALRAARTGNTDVAELLLAAGADVKTVDRHGNGLLHILAMFRPGECNREKTAAVRRLARHLVEERGMDINARNAAGQTPLFTHCSLPGPRISTDSWNPRRGVIRRNREEAEEVVRAVVRDALAALEDLGADFGAQDARGRGLLHAAAAEPSESKDLLFELLVARGLDPMLEDDAQQTPLDVAAACRNKAVLDLFDQKK
ncbi:ankyrin repeat-containing domain protein [Xylariales sp. PMI_506]|nr:ankyrin repeat-containing domain protein [Xylariales sp. PMI_506]